MEALVVLYCIVALILVAVVSLLKWRPRHLRSCVSLVETVRKTLARVKANEKLAESRGRKT